MLQTRVETKITTTSSNAKNDAGWRWSLLIIKELYKVALDILRNCKAHQRLKIINLQEIEKGESSKCQRNME